MSSKGVEFMAMVLLIEVKATYQEPLTPGTRFLFFLHITNLCWGAAFNDNTIMGEGFDQDVIEITELPETGIEYT
jgi:hypothetical protein